MRQPRITGYGGRCARCVITQARRSTPKAVGRVSFGAHHAREALKGQPSGGHAEQAYKHRARDAGGTGGLAALPARKPVARAERPNRPARDRAASVSRDAEARGSIVTPAFRAPSLLPRASDANRTTGEPGARSNNTGGGALAWPRMVQWRRVLLSPFVPAQALAHAHIFGRSHYRGRVALPLPPRAKRAVGRGRRRSDGRGAID